MTALFRASRESRGPDPHTNLKIAIFSVGAVLGLIGMALDNRWFIYAAIAVLAIGVILRLIAARADREQDAGDDDSIASRTGE